MDGFATDTVLMQLLLLLYISTPFLGSNYALEPDSLAIVLEVSQKK